MNLNWDYKTNPHLTPVILVVASEMSGNNTRNAATPDKRQMELVASPNMIKMGKLPCE
jgi:hypothetical protein